MASSGPPMVQKLYNFVNEEMPAFLISKHETLKTNFERTLVSLSWRDIDDCELESITDTLGDCRVATRDRKPMDICVNMGRVLLDQNLPHACTIHGAISDAKIVACKALVDFKSNLTAMNSENMPKKLDGWKKYGAGPEDRRQKCSTCSRADTGRTDRSFYPSIGA